jgi:hypothetical protein
VSPDNFGPSYHFERQRHPRTLAGSLLCAILIALSVGYSYGQENWAPVRAFTAAVDDYVSMHRRIERSIEPIQLNSTAEAINRFIERMATAVRAERADAKQGDLFSAAVAPEFRRRINDALLAHGFTVADVRAEELAHGIDAERVRLKVNGTFPWAVSVAMFPCVLDALPPLPSELQYRIVGYDLLLIDIHASLVVDILPSALVDLDDGTSRIDGARQ